jgi:hypothetical protein
MVGNADGVYLPETIRPHPECNAERPELNEEIGAFLLPLLFFTLSLCCAMPKRLEASARL